MVDADLTGLIIGMTLQTKSEEMLKEAEELAKIHKNIVIKLPMTPNGLKACKALTEKGIKTNVILIFSAVQALLASISGATYVSPFVGRLHDIDFDGISLIEEIADIFTVHNIKAEIITASTRSPLHITKAARAGVHIATVPYTVIMQMTKHPLTDLGIERFLNDWSTTGTSIV